MANATVEKLKGFGIRHGEKLVVGLTSALFVLFIVLALNKPSLDLTADEIKNNASQAQTNINRPQSEEQIRAQLEGEGLKNPSYQLAVASTAATSLDANRFNLVTQWAQPEPGAGLIRDAPELIAPDVYARPGRGGALVFALDEAGNRIPASDEDIKASLAMRQAYGMGEGGYGSGMGMSPARAAKAEADAKKELERQKRELAKKFVGKEKYDPSKDPAKKAAATVPTVPEKSKETTKGYRWVVVTGTLDNKKLRENYAAALRLDYGNAAPNYQRLDVERQVLGEDGQWSDWQSVEREPNLKVLENLPEADEELAREDTRLEPLVDILPFLRAGYWWGVHMYALTDEAKREIAEPAPGAMMAYGGMYGGMEGYDSGMMGSAGMMGDAGGYDMGSYGMGGEMGMGSGYGSYGGENTNFPKSEAEQVMVRGIDFTVRPDATYRYRSRIVVFNPNKDREDVAAGVDNKAEELFGPWSEPTDEVTVPADVTAYALEMAPSARGRAPEKVHFQVARWSEDDGITAVKAFDAGPGQVLGTPSSVRVPVLDDLATSKETIRVKNVDFNTRQLVVDSAGGMQAIPPISRPEDRVLGNFYQVPAFALMLRPDGTLVVRDEAVDKHNDEMKEMKANYDRGLEDAEKLKKAASGAGAMGSGY